MTGAPTVVDHDAVSDGAWFGAHPGRSCYARAHHDAGWDGSARVTAGTRSAAGVSQDGGDTPTRVAPNLSPGGRASPARE